MSEPTVYHSRLTAVSRGLLYAVFTLFMIPVQAVALLLRPMMLAEQLSVPPPGQKEEAAGMGTACARAQPGWPRLRSLRWCPTACLAAPEPPKARPPPPHPR